jgi:hypothetical protein
MTNIRCDREGANGGICEVAAPSETLVRLVMSERFERDEEEVAGRFKSSRALTACIR